MPDTLDDAAVRRWCGGGLAALRAHQDEIDELNVYPVPDGDTGTNLVLTLMAAAEALEGPTSGSAQAPDPAAGGPAVASGFSRTPVPGSPPGAVEGEVVAGEPTPLGRTMRRMARGALLGARGNSGVIVSQILRGMADTFATSVAVRGGDLARALRTATEAAYAAVARPVEGTVLSVVRAAADGAGRLRSDDLVAVAREAARSAAEALARTPQQLPALARAGVVDAGGRGLVLLLEALVDALTTTTPGPGTTPGPLGGAPAGPAAALVPAAHLATPAGDTSDHGTSDHDISGHDISGHGNSGHGNSGHGNSGHGNSGHGNSGHDISDRGYEVQYLLDAEPPAVDALRAVLDRLGDSLVIVGTGEGAPPTWNVHVHVDDIGAALEAGVEAGRPHRITVTRLADRRHDRDRRHPVGAAGDRAAVAGAAGDRAAVVVATGEGLTALFRAEGAVVVGRNPSTAEMLDAVAGSGSRSVVLLPNDANTLAVANAAAREAGDTGVRVSVVPTRSPVQALAALAVRDPQRSFTDDVIAMAEAAGACRYGEVCSAQREALTMAGRCRPGDLLGLVDGEVHMIGSDLGEVCRRLLDGMLGGGGELITLVLGADAPPDLETSLRTHVATAWPFAELQCYAGGQPLYHLLVGVE